VMIGIMTGVRVQVLQVTEHERYEQHSYDTLKDAADVDFLVYGHNCKLNGCRPTGVAWHPSRVWRNKELSFCNVFLDKLWRHTRQWVLTRLFVRLVTQRKMDKPGFVYFLLFQQPELQQFCRSLPLLTN
jgi:hypothetical protein